MFPVQEALGLKPGDATIPEGGSDDESVTATVAEQQLPGSSSRAGTEPPGGARAAVVSDESPAHTPSFLVNSTGGGGGGGGMGHQASMGGGHLRGHLGYSMPAVAVHKVMKEAGGLLHGRDRGHGPVLLSSALGPPFDALLSTPCRYLQPVQGRSSCSSSRSPRRWSFTWAS